MIICIFMKWKLYRKYDQVLKETLRDSGITHLQIYRKAKDESALMIEKSVLILPGSWANYG